MIKIYFTTYSSQWTTEQWEGHHAQLPMALRENFSRFKRWQDRQSALSGKLLLKAALETNGYNSDLPELLYTDYKRPYLDLPVDFNISHSGNLIACALSDRGKIGIDIEEIKPIQFEYFDRIMSPSEWMTIKEANDPLRCFYNFWSLKESIAKADGRGLSFPLNKLKIENNKARLGEQKWCIKNLEIHTSYSSFIAFDQDQEITVEKILFENPKQIKAL